MRRITTQNALIAPNAAPVMTPTTIPMSAAERSSQSRVLSVTEADALSLALGECCSGTLPDQSALLFRERGVEMQHERVGICAKFRNNEGNALRHQPGDERHVARFPA